MAITDAELKIEIETDPTIRGYVGKSAGDQAILINELQAGITIQRTKVTRQELTQAVIGSEMALLSQEKLQMWQILLLSVDPSDGFIDLENLNVRSQISEVWPSASTTRANIIALMDKSPASRAEEIGEEREIVSHSQITRALKS